MVWMLLAVSRVRLIVLVAIVVSEDSAALSSVVTEKA